MIKNGYQPNPDINFDKTKPPQGGPCLSKNIKAIKKKYIHLRLTEAKIKSIQDRAREENINFSEMIRKIIDFYFDRKKILPKRFVDSE